MIPTLLGPPRPAAFAYSLGRLAALPPFLGTATLAAMPALRSTGSTWPWSRPRQWAAPLPSMLPVLMPATTEPRLAAVSAMPRLLLLRLAVSSALSLPVLHAARMVLPLVV